jgi:hypothetical protein
MAKAFNRGLPEGPWRTDIKTSHWLVYKTFVALDDDTANDYILLQQHMRLTLQQATAELQEHHIKVVNAQTGEMFDPRSFERVYKLALGFESKEDLVMAKLLLEVDDSR